MLMLAVDHLCGGWSTVGRQDQLSGKTFVSRAKKLWSYSLLWGRGSSRKDCKDCNECEDRKLHVLTPYPNLSEKSVWNFGYSYIKGFMNYISAVPDMIADCPQYPSWEYDLCGSRI
ncbi:hypothetical protein LZ30DRAFT_774146 [Colletotrichum cereale]|nr:hypothetical protein LZ30DRAFT_774146 [Colletotrichum cereale]